MCNGWEPPGQCVATLLLLVVIVDVSHPDKGGSRVDLDGLLEVENSIKLNLSGASYRIGDGTDTLPPKGLGIFRADWSNHWRVRKSSTGERILWSVEAGSVRNVEDLHRQAKAVLLLDHRLLVDGKVGPFLEAAAEDVPSSTRKGGFKGIACG